MSQISHDQYREMHERVYGFEQEIPMPRGWIQYKGTEICIDIHCNCGNSSHFDGDFAYALRCPHCSKVFALGQTIRLIELSEEDQKCFDVKDIPE